MNPTDHIGDANKKATVLDRCVEILSAQTAKGSAKYGGPLDVTRPSLVTTLRHAQQEAADLLQYLVHAEREALADALAAARAELARETQTPRTPTSETLAAVVREFDASPLRTNLHREFVAAVESARAELEGNCDDDEECEFCGEASVFSRRNEFACLNCGETWRIEPRRPAPAARAELEAGDGWVACAERMPTEEDGDCEGLLWLRVAVRTGGGHRPEVYTGEYRIERRHWSQARWPEHRATHWRRTGLVRPALPKGGGEP